MQASCVEDDLASRMVSSMPSAVEAKKMVVVFIYSAGVVLRMVSTKRSDGSSILAIR
jgi:hypothetical protein